MKSLRIGLAFLVPIACAPPAVRSAESASKPFVWPAPQGWKSETIPFPLDFAPELSYGGTEEIRFAPHFFDPKTATYFSYSFAWILDGEPSITPERLAADIQVYFFGLSRAVGAEKHATFEPRSFGAHIEAPDTTHYRGVVTTVDAFGDGRALTLNLDAELSSCGGRRVLLVSLSPRPVGDVVWERLLEQRRTFRCAA